MELLCEFSDLLIDEWLLPGALVLALIAIAYVVFAKFGSSILPSSWTQQAEQVKENFVTGFIWLIVAPTLVTALFAFMGVSSACA